MLVQLSTAGSPSLGESADAISAGHRAGADPGLRKPWQSPGTASLVAALRRRNTLAHTFAPGRGW
ncbi:hypothetical protein [Ruminococcus sp.]|uniref:hypothetical protein n=1 Tax=Ruminococcus sp. TaxID=41978 RepID=UPI0025EA1150|nr:hypothetical protein [Ruminococcus sp.]